MTTKTTLGRLLVRAALPLKYKSRADAPFTADYIQKLTTELAKLNPDLYIDILQRLNHIGLRVVSAYGRLAGLTVDDIGAGTDIRNKVKQFNALIDSILDDAKLTNAQKLQKIILLGYKYSDKIKDAVVADHKARNTALYNQMQSKARGNPMQLTQLNFGDLGVRDALNRDIPYFAASPRASGASPFACWVGASSSRKGFYDVQAMTGRAGYLGKQASNATHNVPIIELDCGTLDTGLAVKADNDAIGAVLLRSIGKYPAGTIVTEQMLLTIDDDAELIVRSPMACKSKHGVCAKCSGLNENGKFSSIGLYVALNASKTFIEKATQAGVGCLHPGTPVRMADGSVKPIGQLRIGDTVLGADKYGHMLPAKVTYVFDSGIKPVYKFTYRYGSTRSFIHLLATTLHKVLQSTQASNCAEQQHNGIPRILPAGYKRARISALHATAVARSGGKHIPYALLLGLLLGDGCYTAGVRYVPHLSCADPKLILDTLLYMRSLGLKFVFHKGSLCYYRISKLDSAYAGRNYARSILALHDMLGKYAHEKVIPTDATLWDNESISALISGLIITDGCLLRCGKAKSPSVSFASTSIKLVMGLRHHLFMRCAAAMPRIKRNKYGNRKRVLYSVTYAQPTEALKVLRFIKLYGVKLNLRLEYIQLLLSQPQAYSGVRSRRVSCEFVGNMPTVDILVDNKDHLFVLANGMIVSNSKHVGGTGGKMNLNPLGLDQPTGMDALLRLFYVPSTFRGAAVLAPVDGKVNDIRKAPQGGHYITVGAVTTYAPQARTVRVKVGDLMTAGDKLTNGIPNPSAVVLYKGLGLGRRYFLELLNRTLKLNKWGVNKRNLLQFSRSFLDNVLITDPDGVGQYLPGDVVNYSALQKDWLPRLGTILMLTGKARNLYLLMPALHYTIGTRITPAVQKDLKAHGFDKIHVNAKLPPFKAKFVRSQSLLLNDLNWLPRMMGLRLQQSLFDAAQKGITDRYDSPSYIDKVVASPYKPQG